MEDFNNVSNETHEVVETSSSNVSNETHENIEKIRIGAHEVEMITKDGVTTIETPEGLEDDPIFKKEAERIISGMGTVNRKGMELNAKMRELEEKERLLAEAEANLKKPMKKSLIKEIMEELGAEDEDDLDNFTRAEYLKAQEKVEASRKRKEAKLQTEKRVLEAFSARGGDTADLKRYAKTLHAPITQALVNSYINSYQTKPTFASENISKVQGKTISFVPKGSITAKGRESYAKKILKTAKGGHRW